MSAGGHENCEYQNINSYLTYTSLVQTSVSILMSSVSIYTYLEKNTLPIVCMQKKYLNMKSSI